MASSFNYSKSESHSESHSSVTVTGQTTTSSNSASQSHETVSRAIFSRHEDDQRQLVSFRRELEDCRSQLSESSLVPVEMDRLQQKINVAAKHLESEMENEARIFNDLQQLVQLKNERGEEINREIRAVEADAFISPQQRAEALHSLRARRETEMRPFEEEITEIEEHHRSETTRIKRVMESKISEIRVHMHAAVTGVAAIAPAPDSYPGDRRSSTTSTNPYEDFPAPSYYDTLEPVAEAGGALAPAPVPRPRSFGSLRRQLHDDQANVSEETRREARRTEMTRKEETRTEARRTEATRREDPSPRREEPWMVEPGREVPRIEAPERERHWREEPMREVPRRTEAPDREGPWREEPMRELPRRAEAPNRERHLREEPMREVPRKMEAPDRERPMREELIRELPRRAEAPDRERHLREEPMREVPRRMEAPDRERHLREEPMRELPRRAEAPDRDGPWMEVTMIEVPRIVEAPHIEVPWREEPEREMPRRLEVPRRSEPEEPVELIDPNHVTHAFLKENQRDIESFAMLREELGVFHQQLRAEQMTKYRLSTQLASAYEDIESEIEQQNRISEELDKLVKQREDRHNQIVVKLDNIERDLGIGPQEKAETASTLRRIHEREMALLSEDIADRERRFRAQNEIIKQKIAQLEERLAMREAAGPLDHPAPLPPRIPFRSKTPPPRLVTEAPLVTSRDRSPTWVTPLTAEDRRRIAADVRSLNLTKVDCETRYGARKDQIERDYNMPEREKIQRLEELKRNHREELNRINDEIERKEKILLDDELRGPRMPLVERDVRQNSGDDRPRARSASPTRIRHSSYEKKVITRFGDRAPVVVPMPLVRAPAEPDDPSIEECLSIIRRLTTKVSDQGVELSKERINVKNQVDEIAALKQEIDDLKTYIEMHLRVRRVLETEIGEHKTRISELQRRLDTYPKGRQLDEKELLALVDKVKEKEDRLLIVTAKFNQAQDELTRLREKIDRQNEMIVEADRNRRIAIDKLKGTSDKLRVSGHDATDHLSRKISDKEIRIKELEIILLDERRKATDALEGARRGESPTEYERRRRAAGSGDQVKIDNLNEQIREQQDLLRKYRVAMNEKEAAVAASLADVARLEAMAPTDRATAIRGKTGLKKARATLRKLGDKTMVAMGLKKSPAGVGTSAGAGTAAKAGVAATAGVAAGAGVTAAGVSAMTPRMEYDEFGRVPGMAPWWEEEKIKHTSMQGIPGPVVTEVDNEHDQLSPFLKPETEEKMLADKTNKKMSFIWLLLFLLLFLILLKLIAAFMMACCSTPTVLHIFQRCFNASSLKESLIAIEREEIEFRREVHKTLDELRSEILLYDDDHNYLFVKINDEEVDRRMQELEKIMIDHNVNSMKNVEAVIKALHNHKMNMKTHAISDTKPYKNILKMYDPSHSPVKVNVDGLKNIRDRLDQLREKIKNSSEAYSACRNKSGGVLDDIKKFNKDIVPGKNDNADGKDHYKRLKDTLAKFNKTTQSVNVDPIIITVPEDVLNDKKKMIDEVFDTLDARAKNLTEKVDEFLETVKANATQNKTFDLGPPPNQTEVCSVFKTEVRNKIVKAFQCAVLTSPSEKDASWLRLPYPREYLLDNDVAGVKWRSNLVSGKEWFCHPGVGRCYKIVKRKGSWYDADKYCRNRGSTLTSIDSMKENDVVQHIINFDFNMTSVDDHFWIGAKEYEVWKWFAPMGAGSDKKHVIRAVDWLNFEEERGVGCLTMCANDGKWHTRSCKCINEINGFVCERELQFKS